jgi:alpha-ketoglutarate-dependent taurine dioxygenase
MKRDTILTIKLPGGNGLQDCAVREPGQFEKPGRPFTRRALAAAHVVADPLSAQEPWLEAALKYGVGDVVVLDNASLLHSATLTDPADPRTLWRITIKEERKT